MKIVKQIFMVLMFTVLLNTSSVFAEEGDGTGSKDGSVQPLNFKYIQLKDGTRIDDPNGIPLKPEFILKFDKNIVNMLVWEKNRKTVTLSTEENKKIPIIVSKMDDTVDFEHRQEMFVKPVNALESGRTYYIKVSPDLLAKNFKSTLGDTTNGKGIKIAFKTKKADVKSSETSNNENTKETDSDSKADEVLVVPEDSISERLINNWLLFGIGVLILCWVGVEIVSYRKK